MTYYYIKNLTPYRPLRATCSSCEVETVFSGFLRIRYENYAVHQHEYQCQSCGVLCFDDAEPYDSYFDHNLIEHELVRVALDHACECGGQFRRDRNIFCPHCHHRHDPKHNCRDDQWIFIPREEFDAIK